MTAMTPTLSELLLALVTDQPLSKAERWEIALHVLRLVRRLREAHEPVGRQRSEVRCAGDRWGIGRLLPY